MAYRIQSFNSKQEIMDEQMNGRDIISVLDASRINNTGINNTVLFEPVI